MALLRGVAGASGAGKLTQFEAVRPDDLALIAQSYRISQALYAACALRLPDLVAEAKKAYPELRVLALLPVSEAGKVRPVLSSGADGVLTRLASADELEAAVRKVAAGERVVAAAALTVLVGTAPKAAEGPTPGHPLTAKEREVLDLLAKGLSNREIATTMVVSTATVKSHLSNIYEKLGARNRQDAVGRAIEQGLLG